MVGNEAGVATTSGLDNTFVGGFVARANTTGSYNTALGTAALYSNTTASNNTAVGYQAGYSNTTGGQNTLVGWKTGHSLTTGVSNTFVGCPGPGDNCGSLITSGSFNTILGAYTGNQGGLDIRTSNNNIVLSDGDGNPRVHVDGSGYFKAKQTESFETYSKAQAFQFRGSSSTLDTLWVDNASSSMASSLLRLACDRSNSSDYHFLTATSGNLADDEFRLRGDGNAYADGSWNGGGADYAEYFEWSDGNTSNEDRRGFSVVLVDNKIRKATAEDDVALIVGVISGNPSVVGDTDMDAWKHKYLRDDYGTYQRDENDERILNPDYDADQEYTSRENRPEWDTVGLMGKLRIRKGHPTGSNWIKMRDVSDTVEEWLVR
jgi:hypothetical protein